MGVDQLVTGGDVDNPVFQSVSTEKETIEPQSRGDVGIDFDPVPTEDEAEYRPFRFLTDVSGRGDYVYNKRYGKFNGDLDPVFTWGYNFDNQGTPEISGETALGWQIEGYYNAGNKVWTEMFVHLFDINDNTPVRPLQVGYDRTNDHTIATVEAHGDEGEVKLKHRDVTTGDILQIRTDSNDKPEIATTASKVTYKDADTDTQHLVMLGSNGFLSNGFGWVGTETGSAFISGRDSGGTDHAILRVSTDDDLELGDGTLPIDHQNAPSQSVVWNSDTTANRPDSPSTGQRYFDTDLGQPIWYDGTNWVDAQGTTI